MNEDLPGLKEFLGIMDKIRNAEDIIDGRPKMTMRNYDNLVCIHTVEKAHSGVDNEDVAKS